MPTYTDTWTADPLTGKDVGLFFGVIHEGVTPTGTPNDTLQDFVLDPSTYGPFYPATSQTKTFLAGKTDVSVYDDGVEATISTFDPTTGTASLSAAPAKDSVMTADCVEQRELYIAQNAKLTPNQDEEDLNQLRCSETLKSYGNIEFTLTADFKVADLEAMKIIFEETTTDGIYRYPEEPPEIYCCIVLYENSSITGLIYCDDVRADFTDIISAKAGKDAVENGFELTIGSVPLLVDVALSST
jgi:hypothetical protein